LDSQRADQERLARFSGLNELLEIGDSSGTSLRISSFPAPLQIYNQLIQLRVQFAQCFQNQNNRFLTKCVSSDRPARPAFSILSGVAFR
jgi:hypothetical protein